MQSVVETFCLWNPEKYLDIIELKLSNSENLARIVKVSYNRLLIFFLKGLRGGA